MKYVRRFLTIAACATICNVSILAADREQVAPQKGFSAFWNKFKSAVTAGDKAAVAEMTKFPVSMSYLEEAVRNKEDFLRRYDEIFDGEANAAQCFARAKPQKDSDGGYEVYCPFQKTPDDWENTPIRFIFELTKSGWKFTGLDNVNE